METCCIDSFPRVACPFLRTSFVVHENIFVKRPCAFFFPPFLMLFFCYFQGALYVLLNNRMLFLIVHYWEVMVDVWPVIVQVRRISKLKYSSKQYIKSRQACHRSGNGQEKKLKLLMFTEVLRNFIFESGKSRKLK